MNKHQYLDELGSQLYFLSDSEREDAIKEFESHIDDTAATRPELTEEQVVDRLPPPASVAARYYAETSESDERPSGQGGRARRGFSFGGLKSMFSFARRDERVLAGKAAGVGRLEIRAIACDISLKPGAELAYEARGRWDDAEAPLVEQDGDRLEIDCSGDVDFITVALPPSIVELIISSASGDLSVELPPGASLAARLASGDVSCRADGGAVSVSTASGDVNVSGQPADVEVSTASGDVAIHGAMGGVEAATQSGDIRIDMAGAESDVKARSMSGDIAIGLAPGARPSVRAESVSGDVSSPGNRTGRGPVGCVMQSDGGPGSVQAKSVSGDVSVG